MGFGGKVLKKVMGYLLVFVLVFSGMASAGLTTAQAASDSKEEVSIKFSKKKATLYPGNEIDLGLEISGAYWYDVRLTSSKPSVAEVDGSGYVTAKAKGSTVITASYGNVSAKCKVKVGASKVKIGEIKGQLYEGQTVNLKADISVNGTSSLRFYDKDGYTEYSAFDYEEDGNGKFKLTPVKAGTYTLEWRVYSKNKYYTDKTKIEVLPCGLEDTKFAVAKGASINLKLENAKLVSVKLVDRPETSRGSDDDYWDDWYDWDDDYDDYEDDDYEEDYPTPTVTPAPTLTPTPTPTPTPAPQTDKCPYNNGTVHWHMEGADVYRCDAFENRIIEYFDDNFFFISEDIYFDSDGVSGKGYYDILGNFLGKEYHIGTNSGYSMSSGKTAANEVNSMAGVGSFDDMYWEFYNEEDGKASVKGNTVTGVEPGVVFAEVTYKTKNGNKITSQVLIFVTDPKYKKFEGALKAGETYSPSFEGGSEYSKVELKCDDSKIIEVTDNPYYYGYSNSSKVFRPKAYGSATVTVTIDGRSFKQKVNVYDPKFNVNMCVLKKGKSRQLSVSGIPANSTIQYVSSNSKVVTVSDNGKITAKKDGSVLITAIIDGVEGYCSVTVGKGEGLKAVEKAQSVLGSTYSQDRRMEKGYYDCSSLVWRSYHDAGIDIGGTSTYAPTAASLAQYMVDHGKVVAYELISYEELLPGDLIFYKGGHDNGRYKWIDHVAMYAGVVTQGTSSNNYTQPMIVHASHGVEMSSYYHRSGDVVVIARPTAKTKD